MLTRLFSIRKEAAAGEQRTQDSIQGWKQQQTEGSYCSWVLHLKKVCFIALGAYSMLLCLSMARSIEGIRVVMQAAANLHAISPIVAMFYL